MPRINRRKSIHTPPKRSKISPSKREPMPDVGPTEFTLQRKMETIGEGIFCRVDDHRIAVTGKPGSQSAAEFASSSPAALLLHNGRIIMRQYRAASEYSRLHRTLFGRSTPPASGLSKVLATTLPERLAEATRASRHAGEMDEETYTDWIIEQRTLFERGEYRLRHMEGSITSRRNVRIALRSVLIDQIYPTHLGLIARLRRALNELADVWGLE